MRWRLLQTTTTVTAACTDVATAFRQTRRFRPVAIARLGSIEAQGQGEAVASLAAMVKHYGDGAGTTEMIGDVEKKNREKRKSDGDGVSAFITRSRHTETTPSSFSTLARCRRQPPRRLEDDRRSPTVNWLPRLLFIEFTELPFVKIFKLLPKLHGNSKISKNKSCSKTKVLQLCFYNQPLIRSTF